MIGSADIVETLPFAEVDHSDHVVVLGLDSAACAPLHLSGSGAAVWAALTGGATPYGELVDRLARENEQVPTVIDTGVRRFVAALVEAGLASVHPPDTGHQ